jgi:hypothetical protein
MGCGTWNTDSFISYSTSKGLTTDTLGFVTSNVSNQEMFKAKTLDSALDPKNVIRECCDSEDHPNTLPVMIALDVTGSMGQAAVEVAKKLNGIMTKLYENIVDVEFMIMGIGDLAYDYNPIQASQFESDIRIAEQLDKVYFEFGGGGNGFESYSAAWYFGLHHTKLDCWKRGKRGIIITIGDERLNPYLPMRGRCSGLIAALGDNLEKDVETSELFEEASKKFDIYHIHVRHGSNYDKENIEKSFKSIIAENHFKEANLDNITDTIVDIIVDAAENDTPVVAATSVNTPSNVSTNENGEIVW